jgi:hypothetical protein
MTFTSLIEYDCALCHKVILVEDWMEFDSHQTDCRQRIQANQWDQISQDEEYALSLQDEEAARALTAVNTSQTAQANLRALNALINEIRAEDEANEDGDNSEPVHPVTPTLMQLNLIPPPPSHFHTFLPLTERGITVIPQAPAYVAPRPPTPITAPPSTLPPVSIVVLTPALPPSPFPTKEEMSKGVFWERYPDGR